MDRHLIRTAAIVVTAALAAGCAQTDERAEFRRHMSAELTAVGPGSGPQTQADLLPQLTDKSTLSDYLTYAALNNPALESAFHHWRAALERIPQMGALPDPQLAWRYFVRNKMGTGPDMEMRQTMGLSQMIPWPGKLIVASDMARQEAQAAFGLLQAQKLKLFNEVKQAYYEYYYLGRAIAVTDENVRLMGYLESVARTRYKGAESSYPDVIRAQVELGKLQNELISLLDMKSPLAARLNAALNRPVDAALPIPQSIQESQIDLEERSLLESLVSDNPQLQAMDSEVAARSAGVDLARQGYLPDLMVGVEWMDMSAVSGAMMSAKDDWVAMAGISLPIWWAKNAAAVREAQARRRAAELDKAAMSNMLQAELKMAAYGYRDSMRRVSLYRDNLLPKARQSLKATQATYEAGAAGFSDLVDSQRVLLEFELAYERALTDSQQRLAELGMLAGREIPSRQEAQTAPAR